MIILVNNTLNESVAMYFPKLVDVLKKSKYTFKIVTKTEDLKNIHPTDVKGIIISGSPLMITKQSIIPNIDQYLLNVLCMLRFDVPILGICFGSQLINNLYGGTLRKLRKPFCEEAVLMFSKEHPFSKSVTKGRFCLSYVINEVPPDFKVIAHAQIRSKVIPCLIKCKTKNIYGCLFHPEFTEDTHYIIHDFLKLCT